jgi:hypothetical protein
VGVRLNLLLNTKQMKRFTNLQYGHFVRNQAYSGVQDRIKPLWFDRFYWLKELSANSGKNFNSDKSLFLGNMYELGKVGVKNKA